MKTIYVAMIAMTSLYVVGCSDNSIAPSPTDAQAATPSVSNTSVDNAILSPVDRTRDRIEGPINDIDVKAGSVTIRKTVVQTDTKTKIERNGFHVSLSEFKIGDWGQARWSNGAKTASKVEATGK